MHGIGNDFVVIDARSIVLPEPGPLAKRLCRRRFGVGADQLLLILDSDDSDIKMRIFNSDGTEVEMCGNGIRCVAKYVWENGISGKSPLVVETPAGPIKPEKAGDMVRVNMGRPRLEAKDIPVKLNGRVVDYPLKVYDSIFPITCVSMGNPHAVIFMEEIDGFPVDFYGPKIEHHVLFPMRTNVEFIEIRGPKRIKMRVWERGAGETMACGTGASAAVVASAIKGFTERTAVVELPGGELSIEWAEDDHVYMTGPAVKVYEGEIDV